MGNEASQPSSRPALTAAQLSAHVQWCLQQSARLQHQQSVLATSLFSPLFLPSSSSPSSSLLSHLTASLSALHALIDETLRNKDRQQMAIAAREDQIRGYEGSREANAALAAIGQQEHQQTDEAEAESRSREERRQLGNKSLLLSSLSAALLSASLQAQVLAEERSYLQKRLSRYSSADYLHDAVAAGLQSADAQLNALLPLLASSRLLLASCYRDAHLHSLLFLCHEWMRVLTGLQAVWAGRRGYTPPSSSTSNCTASFAALQPPQPLIGVSLTSPLQTHVAPPSVSAAASAASSAAFLLSTLSDMQEGLLAKSRVLDSALHRNETQAVNDCIATLQADHVFAVPASTLSRLHPRLVSVLQLHRRRSVTATEAAMAIANMRNRLSTLSAAIPRVAAGSQRDVLVSEAHGEARAFRDLFALLFPQVVESSVRALETAAGRERREREEIRAGLRSFEAAARTAGTGLVPPPVPRRPSFSGEGAREKERLAAAATADKFAESGAPAANGMRKDGANELSAEVINVHEWDDDESAVQEALMLLSAPDAGSELEVAVATPSASQRGPAGIVLETPGASRFWWKEPSDAQLEAGGKKLAYVQDDVDRSSAEEQKEEISPVAATAQPVRNGSDAAALPSSSSSRYPVAAAASLPMSPPPPPPPRPERASLSLKEISPSSSAVSAPALPFPIARPQILPPPLPSSFSSPAPPPSSPQPPPIRTSATPAASPPVTSSPAPQSTSPRPASSLFLVRSGSDAPTIDVAASAPSSPSRSPPHFRLSPSSSAPSLVALVPAGSPPAPAAATASASASQSSSTRKLSTRASRRQKHNASINTSAEPSFSTTLAALLPPRRSVDSPTTPVGTVVPLPSVDGSSASVVQSEELRSPSSVASAPLTSPSLSPQSPALRSIIRKGGARRRSGSAQRVSFSEVVHERLLEPSEQQSAQTAAAAVSAAQVYSYDTEEAAGEAAGAVSPSSFKRLAEERKEGMRGLVGGGGGSRQPVVKEAFFANSPRFI